MSEDTELNRLSWNVATARHHLHKGDQAAFLRKGGSTLFPEERQLLGKLHDQALLHLQCNAGQDTLSIAQELGASVTGVDISDDAIAFANQLSAESGIPGTFVRSDLFEWFESTAAEQYEVVFTSYGTVDWLPDLTSWAHGISKVLRPGGRFVLVDFHPTIQMFSGEGDWKPAYDSMGGGRIQEDGVGDYVGESGNGLTHGGELKQDLPKFKNPHDCVSFCWGIGDILGALLGAGLKIESFTEFPFSNGWKPILRPEMLEGENGRMFLPTDLPTIPMMFAVSAVMEE